jgi:hypothetical protein
VDEVVAAAGELGFWSISCNPFALGRKAISMLNNFAMERPTATVTQER